MGDTAPVKPIKKCVTKGLYFTPNCVKVTQNYEKDGRKFMSMNVIAVRRFPVMF